MSFSRDCCINQDREALHAVVADCPWADCAGPAATFEPVYTCEWVTIILDLHEFRTPRGPQI